MTWFLIEIHSWKKLDTLCCRHVLTFTVENCYPFPFSVVWRSLYKEASAAALSQQTVLLWHTLLSAGISERNANPDLCPCACRPRHAHPLTDLLPWLPVTRHRLRRRLHQNLWRVSGHSQPCWQENDSVERLILWNIDQMLGSPEFLSVFGDFLRNNKS